MLAATQSAAKPISETEGPISAASPPIAPATSSKVPMAVLASAA